MHLMQWQEHTKWSKFFTLKSHQRTNAMGEMGGRTRKTTNEFQDLDLVDSPQQEERLIGGMVDLDLLSLFPKSGQESLEGLRETQAIEGQQWREEKMCWATSF